MCSLLKHEGADSKIFKSNQRLVNTNISFASSVLEDRYMGQLGVPAVMIQGQIKHMIGSALTNGCPAFLQTYFRENSNTVYNVSEDIKRISEKIKEEINNHIVFYVHCSKI